MPLSATKKTPFRILCLGNSLTAGYPSDNPYAGKLKEKLEAAFPGIFDVSFHVDGVPGDLVTRGSFIKRMESNWSSAEQPSYDWTIVLGGTNDIGWGVDSSKIVEGLKTSWDIPLKKGGKVLALTIPEVKGKWAGAEERRNYVNDAIRAYKKTNFFYFDLHKSIPYHDMPPVDRTKYWEMDGVHYTAAGYDLMGERIAESLAQILRLAEAQDTEISSVVADARQRRAIEQLAFEEEGGDPKRLSQGYIVVRRSDLD